jgi:uncharacterized protein (TIRG00374 family)
LRLLKYWRAGLLGVVASLLAIYFIASQTKDVGLMWSALRSADYGWVLVSMGIIVIGLFARGARWKVLLGGALPFGRAFDLTNISYLLNNVLPLRVGELARTYLATQATPPVPVMKSIGTIVVERLVDVLAVLVILALALSAGPLPNELRASAAFFVPVVIVGFAVLLILASQRKRALSFGAVLIARLPVIRRWNVVAWLEHFLDGLVPLTQPADLIQVLLLTTASWICSLLSGYVLMIAFFGHADWATTCLFSAAASLAVAVPAVPGNLGTYEVSILLALRAMGYGDPIATATAFAVAVHAVNLLVNSSLGVYGFIHEGVSLGQLSQGVREMKTPSS